jgi:hypothetical protein
VFKDVSALKKELGGITRLEGAQNTKIISAIATKYAKQLNKAKVKEFTPRQLQEFKTNLYDEINFARSQLSSTPIKETVKKTFASAAKDELENIMPGIGEVNRQYGPLKDLQTNIQPVVSRVANRDPVSLSTLLKMGVGETVAPGGSVAGAALGIGAMPGMQSRLAIALNKARTRPVLQPGAVPPELWPIIFQQEQLNSAQ